MTGAEIALAAAAVSTAASVGATAYSAVQQSEAADNNAKVAKRQAAWEQMRAKAEADRQAERDKRLLSTQRARIAAGGLDPADASPLQLLSETAAQANVDYRNILLGGEMESNRWRSQAAMARSESRNALIGGAFEATSKLASGASAYGKYQTQMKDAGGGLRVDDFYSQVSNAYTNGRALDAPSSGSGSWDWMGGY